MSVANGCILGLERETVQLMQAKLLKSDAIARKNFVENVILQCLKDENSGI
jgi:hypothetical protein